MEGVEVKKRGRPKGSTKKKAAVRKKFQDSEKAKKPKKKKQTKTSAELIDDIVSNTDSLEKDLELLLPPWQHQPFLNDH